MSLEFTVTKSFQTCVKLFLSHAKLRSKAYCRKVLVIQKGTFSYFRKDTITPTRDWLRCSLLMCENTTTKFSFSLVMAQECNHSDSLTHLIHQLTLVLIEFLPLRFSHIYIGIFFSPCTEKVWQRVYILLTLCQKRTDRGSTNLNWNQDLFITQRGRAKKLVSCKVN